MKLRYTFIKGSKQLEIEMSVITMSIYLMYLRKGYEVIKREVFLNNKWEEII